MVVVFVMNRELVQLLTVKFFSAMPTDPWKHFERLLSVGLLQLSLCAPCHMSLDEGGGTLYKPEVRHLILKTSRKLYQLCTGPTENPDCWFDPS